MKRFIVHTTVIALVMFMVERADATTFEALGSAIGNALGTKKVKKKTFTNDAGKNISVFYSTGTGGQPGKFAFVEKGIYNPGNCTHTWVIGINATTQKVNEVRVVEMSCQHAFPTRKASYTSQYKNKGPADYKNLKGEIKTIAKATGSSDLMTDAVQRAISNAIQARTKF